METFFNTIRLAGEELQKEIEGTKSQNELIYKFFQENDTLELTPFEVWNELQLRCPITSVRRALTTLTLQNKLEKKDAGKVGIYGKKNFVWFLRKGNVVYKTF